jgi:hypothetical protein
MPTAFTEKKLLIDFLMGYISISIQSKEGQKGSFKCSQTDSSTAEKEPTRGFLPEKSNVKCRAVYRNMMKTAPAISKAKTFLSLTKNICLFRIWLLGVLSQSCDKYCGYQCNGDYGCA